MKKTLFLLMILGISSCADRIEEIQPENENTKLNQNSEDHFVTYEDIVALIQSQNNDTRSNSKIGSMVECLVDKYNDTLLYVNKKQNGGWVLYSTDSRVPAIVGQSETGSFDELMLVDCKNLWIQSIMEDMAIIKKLPDDYLNFSKKEIADNKAFWKSITMPNDFFRENHSEETRALPLNKPTGHYELCNSTTYTEAYDSISRLTHTNWKQSYPYNNYCPLKSNSTAKAPAGCVAIAGAQILFYLHDSIGVPTTAPSEAYCYGDINSYTWSQYNYTTAIWEQMKNYDSYSAPLIADIGRRLNMHYGDDGSGAYTSDLVNNVFAPYGISCTYATYNTSLLINSLANNMPVILSAYSFKTTTTDNDQKKVGHAFIADRYKRTRIVTKNVYEWVYDYVPPKTPLPRVPFKEEYTYYSPSISMIGINWGWGINYYDPSEWFSLTGDWILNSYNWNIDRHMIYGFQAINN